MQKIADLREKAILDEKAIYARGLEVGVEKGKREGETKQKKEIAKKMKEEGLAGNIIIRLTGLTEKDLENL